MTAAVILTGIICLTIAHLAEATCYAGGNAFCTDAGQFGPDKCVKTTTNPPLGSANSTAPYVGASGSCGTTTQSHVGCGAYSPAYTGSGCPEKEPKDPKDE
jgi:hypothetical protein